MKEEDTLEELSITLSSLKPTGFGWAFILISVISLIVCDHLDALNARSLMSPSSPAPHLKSLAHLKSMTSPLISARQAYELHRADQADFLDARNLFVVYMAGHIPNAQHAPWTAYTQGKRDGRLVDSSRLESLLRAQGLSEDRPIIVYGSWDKGWGEETRIYWMLDYAGHHNIYVLEGGWSAWRAIGGARSLGRSPAKKKSRWTLKINPKVRVQTSEVTYLIDSGFQAIDTRTQKEYEGATPYGSPFGGHLKGATHLHWASLLDQGQMRSKEELRALFTAHQISLDRPIFTYCTGGVRSAFVYFGLKYLGHSNVRNYDGSWWHWSQTTQAQSDLRAP